MGPLTDTDPLQYLSYFSSHEGKEKKKKKRKKWDGVADRRMFWQRVSTQLCLNQFNTALGAVIRPFTPSLFLFVVAPGNAVLASDHITLEVISVTQQHWCGVNSAPPAFSGQRCHWLEALNTRWTISWVVQFSWANTALPTPSVPDALLTHSLGVNILL